MSGMYGADVADLRATAAQFERYADQLRTDRAQVSDGIRISAWVGPFAARFRVTWDNDHSRRMLAAADRLAAAARVLRDNAAEQDRASAASGSSGAGGFTVKPGWGTPVNRPTPTEPSGHVRILAEMEDKQDGLRIQEIHGDDGVIRYVVYINGTESATNGTLNWPDAVRGATGRGTPTSDAIRDHLLTRIPTNAEVAFVGFSQGGIVAQQLADEGWFNTQVVMTMGSPEVSPLQNYGGADLIRLSHNADHWGPINLLTAPARAVDGAINRYHLDQISDLEKPAPGLDTSFRTGHYGFDGHTLDAYEMVAWEFGNSMRPEHIGAQNSLDRFGGTIIRDES